MRRLSGRQAASCEQAHGPRCHCRCHGRLHGGGRALVGDATVEAALDEVIAWLGTLPAEDPHYVGPKRGWLQLPLPVVA